MSVCIDCVSAKVLISHILPQFPHRFVFITIAINPFSRFPTSPFQAPRGSKSRHFGSKIVVLLAIDSPFQKSCFSVRFVQTYSLNSLPPTSRCTKQIQPFPQSCAAACLAYISLNTLAALRSSIRGLSVFFLPPGLVTDIGGTFLTQRVLKFFSNTAPAKTAAGT